MLNSALITAAREAGVALKKVRNGDLYQKTRDIRRDILAVAKRADSQIAQFGDETSRSDKRIVICPVDSESNFKQEYLGAYAVMIGYFEGGIPTFSVVYLPAEDILINATKGAGTQIDGRRITVPKTGSIKSQLIGGLFDSLITHDLRADQNLALVGSKMVELAVRETGGFRISGSIGIDVLLCLRGQLGGLVSPYLEPERRAVFLPLMEAGMKVTDFEGGVISINSAGVIASSREIHQILVKMAERAGI
jgi:myo-inositol-1(or 4)-monophosphatase